MKTIAYKCIKLRIIATIVAGRKTYAAGVRLWHYYFSAWFVFKVKRYRLKMYLHVRSFVNCWLEYVLSQPVDIDLSVLLYFCKVYLGIPSLIALARRSVVSVSNALQPKQPKEMVEELVPQESYS